MKTEDYTTSAMSLVQRNNLRLMTPSAIDNSIIFILLQCRREVCYNSPWMWLNNYLRCYKQQKMYLTLIQQQNSKIAGVVKGLGHKSIFNYEQEQTRSNRQHESLRNLRLQSMPIQFQIRTEKQYPVSDKFHNEGTDNRVQG